MTTAAQIVKPGSTNVVEVADIFDTINRTSFDATATPTLGALLDSSKNALVSPVGLTWAFVTGSQGTWRATIADSVALVDGTTYYARVKLTSAAGVVRTVYVKCLAHTDDN